MRRRNQELDTVVVPTGTCRHMSANAAARVVASFCRQYLQDLDKLLKNDDVPPVGA